LKQALDTESECSALMKKMEHCGNNEQAVFAVMNCIPCILHCENRVGLKILSMLLIEGISNAKKGLLVSTTLQQSELG